MLFQDLDARRARSVEESKELLKRLEELIERGARSQEELDALNARVEDWRQRPEAETTEIDDVQRGIQALTAKGEIFKADAVQVAEDQKRWLAETDAIEKARELRRSRLYAGTLAAQMIGIAVLLLVPKLLPSGPTWPHSIHLDYYSAVASLAPILLIAGLAELALLGPRIAVAVLTYAVPAIGAEATSLVALASHDSTTATFSLTFWGVGSTLASLLGFFVVHVTSPPKSP